MNTSAVISLIPYGKQATKPVRNNAMALRLGDLRIWFSYATSVAFRFKDEPRPTVRQNDWGPTTGKQLNAIDGGEAKAKEQRVESRAFERSLRFNIERTALRVLGDSRDAFI